MVLVPFYALLTVAATVCIHAAGTGWWLGRLRAYGAKESSTGSDPWRVMSILVRTALVLIALLSIEVILWAFLLRSLPEGGLLNFEEAMYLSFTTFTTLGYGDVTLSGPWRILTGIEALNGVILLGWSTALSFAVIQRIWERAQHQ